MKPLKIVLALFLFVVLAAVASAEAYDIETTIEKSMTAALLSSGLDEAASLKIARQYMFMGTVMISKAQLSSDNEGERLYAEAEKTGLALGRALAGVMMVYGDSKLEETARVMMHSVRAGVPADVAADTFVTLAENSYAFDASVAVLHDVSEIVRSLRMQDAGRALCKKVQSLATENVSVGGLEKEILLSARSEKSKQARILAQKEAERIRRDNAGGSNRTGRDSVASSPGNSGGSTAAGSRGDTDDKSSNDTSNENAADAGAAEDSSASDSSAEDGSSSGTGDSSNDSSAGDNGDNDSAGSDGDDSSADGDSASDGGASSGAGEDDSSADDSAGDNAAGSGAADSSTTQ